uniref:Uncharacterized protein n=1 Tax=Rhizophagus irregularis (strain DAOM 181602 / DAOM 197198 / MUCL 43194) TaxID=747089 RepID=U9SUE2_RHIID
MFVLLVLLVQNTKVQSAESTSSGLYFEGPGRQRTAPDVYFEGPGRQRMAPDVNFEGPGRQIMAPDFYLCLTNIINVHFFDFLGPRCRRTAPDLFSKVLDAEEWLWTLISKVQNAEGMFRTHLKVLFEGKGSRKNFHIEGTRLSECFLDRISKISVLQRFPKL